MAAASEELGRFVREALGRGISRADVQKALLDAGWPPDHVDSALRAFADMEFPLPVPRPRPHVSAREAFLYLVLFTTLYISAFHLGSLLFDFIDRAFPDPAARGYLAWADIRLRWSVASLVIAFPVFLYMSYYISRSVARAPVRRASPVRKWLTYLTLFVASSVLIGDMIALVYNLLGGELTVRFVLKILVVAVIAGTVFGYYLWDLRKEEQAI